MRNLNIASESFCRDKYLYFSWMRKHAPVYKARYILKKLYLITRYKDVVEVMKDDRFVHDFNNVRSSSGRKLIWYIPGPIRPYLRNMLTMDDPDHRRLRNLVHKGFMRQQISSWEQFTQSLSDQLLDKLAHQETVDLIDAILFP